MSTGGLRRLEPFTQTSLTLSLGVPCDAEGAVAVFHVPLEWPRSGTHVTLSALEAVAEDEAAAALCQQVAQEVRAGWGASTDCDGYLVVRNRLTGVGFMARLSGVAQGAPARDDGHRAGAAGAASSPGVGLTCALE